MRLRIHGVDDPVSLCVSTTRTASRSSVTSSLFTCQVSTGEFINGTGSWGAVGASGQTCVDTNTSPSRKSPFACILRALRQPPTLSMRRHRRRQTRSVPVLPPDRRGVRECRSFQRFRPLIFRFSRNQDSHHICMTFWSFKRIRFHLDTWDRWI